MNLYCYLYYIDKEFVPLFEFINNGNLLLDDNIYTTKIDDKYYFDFKHGFFDSVNHETIEYIDKIFKYIEKTYKKDYLNGELWSKYVDSIKNKSLKMYCDFPVGIIRYHQGIKIKYINIDMKITELNDIFIEDKKSNPFFYSAKEKKPGDEERYIAFKSRKGNFFDKLLYDGNLDNEIELVHRFFNFVFSLNRSFNIKKCWKCDKYYISKPNNTHNCDRIFDKNLSCSEYSDKITRQHSHDKPIKDLKNYIRHKLQHDPYAYRNYSYENSIKMEEFYGKKKEYVLWSLTYCDDYDGEREKVIEKFKLEKYLKK